MNLSLSNSLCKLASVLTIIVLGCVIYSNTLNAPFHFDDMDYIVHNSSIRNVRDVSAIYHAISHPSRFVGLLSFAVNYHFHQLNVFGYHIVNTMIHIFNALLVWALSLLILNTPVLKNQDIYKSRYLIALFSALLFLTHPVQTQAVTYLSQRFTSLAVLFYLFSLCCYMLGRLKTKGSIWFFILAVISGVLGMFTKQITFTLPFIIIISEFYFLKSNKKQLGVKRDFKLKHFLFILSFALIIPAFFRFNYNNILGRQFVSRSHDQHEEIITMGSYFLTQMRVIVHYVKLLFFPVGLNLDYDFRLSHSLAELSVLFSTVVLITIFVYGVSQFNRSRLLSFGIIWFFVTLSVESTIIPIPHVIFEHRLYLPLAVLSIGLIAHLCTIIQHPKPRFVILVLIIATLSSLAYQRNKVYQTQESLWKDVIQKSPHKIRAYNNLGLAYLSDKKYMLAKQYLQKATELNPLYSNAYNNLGEMYQSIGKDDIAFVYFNKAVALKPNNSQYLNNRAVILKKRGLLDEALDEFTKAIESDRTNAHAYNNRGNIYRIKGKRLQAMADFNKALLINPYFAQSYNNRGLLYRDQGGYQEAILNFDKAIDIQPDYMAAYNNRGILYKDLGQYKNALADMDKAIQLNDKRAKIYNNRGLIYEKLKQSDKALADYTQAIQLDSKYGRAYLNRGFVYLGQNKADLAMDDFNTAVQIGFEPGLSYYYRSLAYYEIQDLQRALEDVEQSIQFGYKPNNVYLQKLRKEILELKDK